MEANSERRLPAPSGVPDEVDSLIKFVNTHPNAEQGEVLDSGAALTAWLIEHDLAKHDLRASDADAACARGMRDALGAILVHRAGPLDGDDQDVAAAESVLREWAVAHPVRVSVGLHGTAISPASDGALDRLAVIVAIVATGGDGSWWHRLKACRNPVCHGAFFDLSRNTSRAFDSSTCSTRIGMRAHRARKRLTEG